eukprot:jgi/Ulvmu1/8706/UM047_0046.1
MAGIAASLQELRASMLAHEQLMASGWDSASTSSDGSSRKRTSGAIHRSQTMPQNSSPAVAHSGRRQRSVLTEASLNHHNALSHAQGTDSLPDSGFDARCVTTDAPFSHDQHYIVEKGASVARVAAHDQPMQSRRSGHRRPRSPSPPTSHPGQTCISAPEIDQLDEDIVSVQAILETQSQPQEPSPAQRHSTSAPHHPSHTQHRDAALRSDHSTLPPHGHSMHPGSSPQDLAMQAVAARSGHSSSPLAAAAIHAIAATIPNADQQQCPGRHCPSAGKGTAATAHHPPRPSQAVVPFHQPQPVWHGSPPLSRSHSPHACASGHSAPASPEAHVRFTQQSRSRSPRPRSLSPRYPGSPAEPRRSSTSPARATQSSHVHHAACCDAVDDRRAGRQNPQAVLRQDGRSETFGAGSEYAGDGETESDGRAAACGARRCLQSRRRGSRSCPRDGAVRLECPSP